MKKWLKNNSLSIVLVILFVVFLVAQSVMGFYHYNSEQEVHSQPQVTYSEFLVSGEFAETVFENWESEFLQMAAFVVLTTFLVQKGSAESKKLRSGEATQQNPRKSKDKDAPWPVRQGGAALKIYEYSLSIVLMLLFVISFGLHAWGGARQTCEENIVHNEECPTTIEYMSTSKFWYESFQNWQSEFLAVFAMVFLSIYLRQKNSPESKPVNTPHSQTGT